MNENEIIQVAVNMHYPNLSAKTRERLTNKDEDITRFEFERTLIKLAKEDERNTVFNKKSSRVGTISQDGDEFVMSPDFIGDEEKRWKVNETKVQLIKPFKIQDAVECKICNKTNLPFACSRCYYELSAKQPKKRIIGVVGNRVGWSYPFVKRKLLELGVDKCDVIVSGGASGVDTYAQLFAGEFGLDLMILYPNPKETIPERFFARNKLIVEMCDYLIAFNKNDVGYSGTTNTINQAKKCGKKVIEVGETDEKGI